MLLKICLPKDAEIIQNANGELLVSLSSFKNDYKSLSLFTIKGETAEDAVKNPSKSQKLINIKHTGTFS